MAYSTSTPPARVAGRAGATGNIWLYRSADSLATVSGINYITNAAKLGMTQGDIVFHIDTTNGVTTQLAVINGATTGTAINGTTNTAGYAAGVTTVTAASAGTGTTLVGDVITFDNDPENEYTLTANADADISNGATLTFTPALVTAIPASAVAWRIKSTVRNLTEGAVGNKLISGQGATKTLTKAEAGATVLFDRAAGIVYTLPTPVPGMKFRFVATVSVTSNAYTVNTSAASVFLVGNVNQIIDTSATSEGQVANGTTHIGMASNGSTTGGLIGSWTEFEALSSTLWLVKGIHVGSGTLATPFTT
jgi:hypothetical protein